MYPIWALFAMLFYLPAMLLFPRLMGMMMTHVITNFALHGFKLTFGEFHIIPWVGIDGKLHLKLKVNRLGFGNPPGFPHKYVVCLAVWVVASSYCLHRVVDQFSRHTYATWCLHSVGNQFSTIMCAHARAPLFVFHSAAAYPCHVPTNITRYDSFNVCLLWLWVFV